MRTGWLVFALIACKRETGAPPVPVKPAIIVADAPTAAVPDGSSIDASAALIELLHGMPSTVRVSSQVKNPAILPAHLVDHDLQTAWNSATGEVAGAWIEVAIGGATIEQLRLTAGHTGHGPKGEDYFTMNPRIRKLSATVDGRPAGTFTLDIARRDLQTIAVHATGVVRLVIDEVEPGSRKSWNEANVSELEVWGTPPASWKPPAHPFVPSVEVGEVATDPDDPNDPCKDSAAARAAFIEEHKNDDNSGGPDHNNPPSCESLALPPTDALGPIWAHGAGACEVSDEIYGPKSCFVQFVHGTKATVGVSEDLAHANIMVLAMTEVDAIPGGPRELMVRFKAPTCEAIGICRADPQLACTRTIVIATDDWELRPRFVGGELVLDVLSGSPPAAMVGHHALVFAK